MRTYKHIQKMLTGQGDDYITVCLLDYIYFKKYYKMIAIGLGKQQTLDADPKAIYEINFLEIQEIISSIFFIIEEAKEIILDLPQRTMKVLKFYFALI